MTAVKTCKRLLSKVTMRGRYLPPNSFELYDELLFNHSSESKAEDQVLANSKSVISGRAPSRMGKPVMPMPRFM